MGELAPVTQERYVWIVRKNPPGHPNRHFAQRWHYGRRGPRMTGESLEARQFGDLRALLPPGRPLHEPRRPDDPTIVESWLEEEQAAAEPVPARALVAVPAPVEPTAPAEAAAPIDVPPAEPAGPPPTAAPAEKEPAPMKPGDADVPKVPDNKRFVLFIPPGATTYWAAIRLPDGYSEVYETDVDRALKNMKSARTTVMNHVMSLLNKRGVPTKAGHAPKRSHGGIPPKPAPAAAPPRPVPPPAPEAEAVAKPVRAVTPPLPKPAAVSALTGYVEGMQQVIGLVLTRQDIADPQSFITTIVKIATDCFMARGK